MSEQQLQTAPAVSEVDPGEDLAVPVAGCDGSQR